MTDGLSWEAIGVLTAIIVPLVGGINAAFYLVLTSQLRDIGRRLDENREDHGKVWDVVHDHEHRITRIESAKGAK